VIGKPRISTPPPPGFKRVAEWKGLRVRTKCTLANGMVDMPEGSFATVENAPQGTGLHLKFDRCKGCGAAFRMTRVRASDVEVVS
jgi:hypothetical protein